MAKISCPILGEFDPGQSKEAREAELFQKEKGIDAVSLAEGAGSEEVKAAREQMFAEAMGIKPKAPEKKAQDKGKETSLFEGVKAQVADLEATLKLEGITYFPLQEFKAKLEDWEKLVSLKEGEPDPELADEFEKVKKSSLRIASDVREIDKRIKKR